MNRVDPESVVQAYRRLRTQQRVADELGISQSSVSEALRAHGIRIGKGSHQRKVDDETLLTAFRELRNQHRLAERLQMTQTSVSYRLRRLGIHLGRGRRAPIHALPMDEVAARYLAGESTIDLGLAYAVDAEVIRRRLRAHGTPRRALPESRARGAKNPQWKGGAAAVHWYRRESYEVAAICLGHPLHPEWVIHHIDEDPNNNSPENLILFQSNRPHLRLHQRLQALRRRGQPVDATLMALESGGLPLPRPPAPIVFGRDIDPLALFERLASQQQAHAACAPTTVA